MKKLLILTCLLICANLSNGQSISVSDSLQIRKALNNVFRNFERPNYDGFSKISSEMIWCLICDSGIPPKPDSQRIGRKSFFDNYLTSIKNSDNWKRALKSNKIILHKQKAEGVIIVAFLTIWNKDEYAPGHEGAQLGIHFLNLDGEYKFAGIETVP
jgi:hypothetical protein